MALENQLAGLSPGASSATDLLLHHLPQVACSWFCLLYRKNAPLALTFYDLGQSWQQCWALLGSSLPWFPQPP